ncbi:SRPBCC domain-containing protein [Zhihengliuella halotolerans]|uniref:Activator of Hsp90 ATPase-like protein n=1 Tax=Zhihengliuella halotolerans TaxID=370736 RepID=A0A4Q8A923_9MICC|nr:SRPBCC domain-containing protein [Zhihengliuella halotolerans]RZU60567.1 activator of Hsp90 ATPase-like protein [Zhihengliuella halotolerans]
MHGLFSHAPAPEPGPSSDADVDPLRFSVRVPVGSDRAFEGFTEYVHLWWPVDEHSHFGDGAHMSLDVDGLSEDSPSGETHRWASLLEAQAPARIELSCTYNFEDLAPSHVVVAFRSAGSETQVELTHTGLAVGEDGQRQAEVYACWGPILERFARFMGAR